MDTVSDFQHCKLSEEVLVCGPVIIGSECLDIPSAPNSKFKVGSCAQELQAIPPVAGEIQPARPAPTDKDKLSSNQFSVGQRVRIRVGGYSGETGRVYCTDARGAKGASIIVNLDNSWLTGPYLAEQLEAI